MKILLVNKDRGWGGCQNILEDLSVELRRRGVAEYWYAAREGSISEKRFHELGFPVHSMQGKHGVSDVRAAAGLISLMRRENFDIVSVNRYNDLFLTALAWRLAFPSRPCGKLMMTYHVIAGRKQLMLGTVDAVVCVSELVRKNLLRGNPSIESKTSVINNGIAVNGAPSPSRFDRNRRRRFFTDRGFPIIGMSGLLWKNQAELVDMIPRLKEEFPDITVALVGSLAEAARIPPMREQVRRLGLEKNVILMDFVPREQVPDIFYDLDLSVTTYRNEAFGIVHLDSLAAGTPVVAYNEGGFLDIFRGENAGILVDGGPDEFAAAVIGLLNDDALRFEMGTNGYDLVERRFSRKVMCDNYQEFYQKLVGA